MDIKLEEKTKASLCSTIKEREGKETHPAAK